MAVDGVGGRLAPHTALDIRLSNIAACTALAACIRSLLGPTGREKLVIDRDGLLQWIDRQRIGMSQDSRVAGIVTISNDGATVLSSLQVEHPAARMLVQLSCSMDRRIGDGTTSVVVITAALLQGLPHACVFRSPRDMHYSGAAKLLQQGVPAASSMIVESIVRC